MITLADGTTIAGRVDGDGPPLLWLPGGPGLAQYLHPVAAPLTGHRHVLLDPRGTGGSDGGPHGVARAVADLEELRRALGIDRWTVIGHSWGADLALAYASVCGPGPIERVISIAGTGVQNDRGWKRAYEQRYDTEPHGEGYRVSAEVHDALIADWRRWITAPDLFARLATLAVPITFVVPTADIRPAWPLAQLHRLIPAARWLEVVDAPHEAWLTHPAALTAALRSALAG